MARNADTQADIVSDDIVMWIVKYLSNSTRTVVGNVSKDLRNIEDSVS